MEEVDDSGTSSFAVLVTFYLSIWKVFNLFWLILLKRTDGWIDLMTKMSEKSTIMIDVDSR